MPPTHKCQPQALQTPLRPPARSLHYITLHSVIHSQSRPKSTALPPFTTPPRKPPCPWRFDCRHYVRYGRQACCNSFHTASIPAHKSIARPHFQLLRAGGMAATALPTHKPTAPAIRTRWRLPIGNCSVTLLLNTSYYDRVFIRTFRVNCPTVSVTI